jgi:hypothetical protein
MLDTPRPPHQNVVLTILGIWFVVALALAALGIVARLQPPAPQIVLLSLTALVILAGWRVSSVHAWAMSMGAMQRLPLSLLITFLVPLLIATHVLLAMHLRRRVTSPIPAPAA